MRRSGKGGRRERRGRGNAGEMLGKSSLAAEEDECRRVMCGARDSLLRAESLCGVVVCAAWSGGKTGKCGDG